MRLAIYGLFIAAICNGCTTINLIEDRLSTLMYIDSALQYQVKAFKKEGKLRGNHISVKRLTMIFGKTKDDKNPNAVGTCSFIKGYPLILIDRKFWESIPESDREQLAFHELGHCLLMRDHCEIKNKEGLRTTIMEPEMMGTETYVARRDEFVNELFSPLEGCEMLEYDSQTFDDTMH